jgi:NADH-quinone oxidoreductase subunit N
LLSSFGSLIVGSLGVIGQNRIKRIIAYSSITHVSFILLGMGCGTVIALTTTILYVLVYSATLLLFFGFMLNTQCFVTGRSLVYLSDFANLGSRGLLITLFSMGGLPPFAGFFIKFYIYICAISSGFYILVILNLLITILTTFYYLFFLKCVFFDTSL